MDNIEVVLVDDQRARRIESMRACASNLSLNCVDCGTKAVPSLDASAAATISIEYLNSSQDAMAHFLQVCACPAVVE